MTAPQPDTEALDDARLGHIHRAFEFVPLTLYDEITKLAEYALGEFITERNALAARLAEAEAQRNELEQRADGYLRLLDHRQTLLDAAEAQRDKAREQLENLALDAQEDEQ